MSIGTLENDAYESIKHAILTRKLLPGTKLSEPALARQLSISRTPVRAAIKRLVAEGLAKAETNQGAEVTLPSAQDIEEVLFMRETLEPQGARLAAFHASFEAIDPLEDLVQKEEEAFRDGDLDRYIKVNDQIHLGIARLSKNRLLEQAIANYLTLNDIFLALFDPIYTPNEEMLSMSEHRQLLNALRQKDGIAAEAAMRYHLRSSRKYVSSEAIRKKIMIFPESEK